LALAVLVTGGSGYLGSHLVKAFVKQGYRVGALVRSTSSGERLNSQDKSFELLSADTLHDVENVVQKFSPDVIVHTACSYGRKSETPFEVFQANVALGMAMLKTSVSLGKPLTFVNTGTVLPANSNLYALTKNQFSDLGRHVSESSSNKLQFIDVALQHMLGPHDDTSKFTSFVIQGCANNVDSISLSNGEQRRDFIFIADVVNAYQTLISKRQEITAYERIEMGSGFAVAIKDFVELVKRLSGASTTLNFGAVPSRPNDPPELKADISRLALLGWSPAFTLENGIKETLRQEHNR
jgi:CDP-paratose synthetase